jgi:hypothetical protein
MPRPGRWLEGASESLRPGADGVPGFGAGVVEPRRITGALKLMLGRFGGAWKEAGSPLGRLACVALLVCWTPGGGANPGAEDMPGGGPK